MKIQVSPNIDADTCETCTNRRPWARTIAEIEGQLRAHGVTWPDFMIIHGRDLPCVEAGTSSGKWNATLYVVAKKADGKGATSAGIFANKNGYFTAVESILDGTAFRE